MKSQPLRQQKIESRPTVNRPIIEDLRKPKVQDEQASTIPIRTVLYVEVGELAHEQVLLLLGTLNEQYADNRYGPHYIVPIRHGMIGTGVLFEAEWEKIVQETCEIRDGQIRLKDGAREVQIIRQIV